jgi:tetratricopeptide (TPR) repeat protein
MNIREKIIYFCSQVQRYGIYSLVFFVPIYFAWFQENYTVFDLNKSAALHLLLSAIIICWLIELTLSKTFNWGGNKFLGLLGSSLGIVFLVSTFFSLNPFISLFGSYERQQGLYNLWSYLLVFFFVLIIITNKRYLEHLIISLLVGSSIVCLYGLIQSLDLDFLSWGESGVQRIFSTFGQPNFLAHYLIVVLPFTVYALFFLSKNVYLRILYILLTSVQGACLVFTLSRGAWISVGASLFLLMLWSLFRKNKKIITWLVFAVTTLLFIISVFTGTRQAILNHLYKSDLRSFQRLVSVLDFENGSNKIRLFYWKAAFHTFKTAPLERQVFGYGPDVLPDVFVGMYQPEWANYERMNSFPDRAHNFVLDILLQFGVIGFLVFGSFSGYIIYKLAQYAWKENQPQEYWLAVSFLFALFAYGINNLFSFSLIGMNVIFYALLGGSWLVANKFEMNHIKITFFKSISLFILTVVFSLFLLFLLYTYNIKPLVADYYYFEVKKSEVRGDCRSILDNMENTLAWYPVSYFYTRAYLHHGTNCFLAITDQASQQQLADNLLDMTNHIPKSDWQYATIEDLAHMYSMLGYYIDEKYYLEAEDFYKQLLRMGPMITVSYQDYGRMKLTQKKYEEAISFFKKGIEVSRLDQRFPSIGHSALVYRQVGYFYNLLGNAYNNDKKYPEALDAYKKAIEIDPLEGINYKDTADFYYQRGNISEAIRYNETGFKVVPENQPWAYFLALLYNEDGKAQIALEYANKAYSLDPGNEKLVNLIKELKMKK